MLNLKIEEIETIKRFICLVIIKPIPIFIALLNRRLWQKYTTKADYSSKISQYKTIVNGKCPKLCLKNL